MKTTLPLLLVAALALAETTPAPTSPTTPSAPSQREADYKAKIAPLMERSCVPCHSSTKKAKGGFKADSIAGLVKGGKEEGPGIVWGNASKSAVYELSAAPRGEEKAMPPRKSDKPALTAKELETLKAWIEAK